MTDFLARTDALIAARGTSRSAVSQKAGYSKGLIQNWDRFEQSPSLKRLAKVAGELKVDPAWLAYSTVPKPVPPPNGFTARKVAIDPDSLLGVAYAAWEADGGQLEERFFGALEMTGLINVAYILRQEGPDLIYDHIGFEISKSLGFSWWVTAHGTRVGIDDPDLPFANWTLAHYQTAMERGDPSMNECLVVSRYTGIAKGWPYERLILPFDGGLIVLILVKNADPRQSRAG